MFLPCIGHFNGLTFKQQFVKSSRANPMGGRAHPAAKRAHASLPGADAGAGADLLGAGAQDPRPLAAAEDSVPAARARRAASGAIPAARARPAARRANHQDRRSGEAGVRSRPRAAPRTDGCVGLACSSDLQFRTDKQIDSAEGLIYQSAQQLTN